MHSTSTIKPTTTTTPTNATSTSTPSSSMKLQEPRKHHQQQHRRETAATSHGHATLPLDASSSSSVKVAVRVRPLLPFEYEHGNEPCIQVFNDQNDDSGYGHGHGLLNLHKSASGDSNSTATTTTAWNTIDRSEHSHSASTEALTPSPSNSHSHNNNRKYQTLQVGRGERSQTYTFDHVFPSSSPQHDVYEQSVTPLVSSCLEGYNATVLAYGQTGSGKTHTILGEASGTIDDVEGTLSNEGVIPRALRQIFNGLEGVKQDLMDEVIKEDAAMNSGNGNGVAAGENGSNGNSHATSNSSLFEYQVKIQFLELYGEDIRDLLTDDHHHSHDSGGGGGGRSTPHPQHLRKQVSVSSSATTSSSSTSMSSSRRRKRPSTALIVRDGKNGEDAEVLGAQQSKVDSANEAMELLKRGLTKRVVGKTAMNANSSRSHAIFTVVVQQTRRKPKQNQNQSQFGGGGTGVVGGQGQKEVEMKTSKIHFVDLSGSESIKRSKTAGKSLKEGIDINKGLLVLGNVISALSSKKRGSKGKSQKQHIPYRDSKLTRLLKGSLGGNHKTLMIACVSPSSSNTVESISTLRYANRAKSIKNKAKINVDPASRVVNELKSQVVALAAELLRVKKKKKQKRGGGGEYNSDDDDDDELEDCPFSIEFLDDLVGAADSQTVWKRNAMRKTALSPIPQQRPMTEPVSSNDSWEGENDTGAKPMHQKMHESTPMMFDHRDDDNSSTSAEDPDLDKNILSYDFALSKLKESLNEATNETLVNYGGGDRPFTPGLGKVRNIDELYDYLHKHGSFELENDNHQQEEKNDTSESDDQVRKGVVSDHVTKLDETIAYNENLLIEMNNCHKRYEDLMGEYHTELQRIKKKVDFYEQEKKRIENVVELIEDGSQYSESMIDVVREKEAKIFDLEKKRAELKMLSKVANENNDEIQNLKNSIDVLKHQRTELKQMAEVISESNAIVDSKLPSHIDYDHEVRGGNQRQINEPPEIERARNLGNQLQPGRNHDPVQQFESENEHDIPVQIPKTLDVPISQMNEPTPRRRNSVAANGQYRNMDANDIHSGDKEEILKLKNEIADLKLMLVGKQSHQAEMQSRPREQRKTSNEDLQRIPTTLNLIQTGTDLSGLEESYKDKTNRQGNQHDSMVKPSISSVEFEKLRRQIYENDYVERRWLPDSHAYNTYQPEVLYDLGNKERPRRRTRKSYAEEEEDISCEDVCAGPLYVVRMFRNLFNKKDPVLRRW